MITSPDKERIIVALILLILACVAIVIGRIQEAGELRRAFLKIEETENQMVAQSVQTRAAMDHLREALKAAPQKSR